ASHDVVCVMGPCALPASPFVYYAQFSQAGWRSAWARGTRPGLYHRIHNRLDLALERWVSTRATRVVACSDSVGAELGVDPSQVTVVPNGVRPDEFPTITPARRAEARRRLGLPADAFVVAFAGEYRTPRKGLAPLIDAVG